MLGTGQSCEKFYSRLPLLRTPTKTLPRPANVQVNVVPDTRLPDGRCTTDGWADIGVGVAEDTRVALAAAAILFFWWRITKQCVSRSYDKLSCPQSIGPIFKSIKLSASAPTIVQGGSPQPVENLKHMFVATLLNNDKLFLGLLLV